jgi:hypothetical protein
LIIVIWPLTLLSVTPVALLVICVTVPPLPVEYFIRRSSDRSCPTKLLAVCVPIVCVLWCQQQRKMQLPKIIPECHIANGATANWNERQGLARRRDK